MTDLPAPASATIQFQAAELADARELVTKALHEDLRDGCDITSTALIPAQARGAVRLVAREPGIVCGLPVAELVCFAVDPKLSFSATARDGDVVQAKDTLARITGPVRSLLTAERTALNFLTLLSGVATLTHRFAAAAAGTSARILDTRKTLPGLRTLQKYAVRCGGGTNHRIGLYDAVLVKDNHLGWWNQAETKSLAAVVAQCREHVPAGTVVEIEVDSLSQLRELLPESPDIILLDNMSPTQLREAVALRNQLAPQVLLEASGGVNLKTVGEIAGTGVDRISVGALTHSAPALDIAFDWDPIDTAHPSSASSKSPPR